MSKIEIRKISITALDTDAVVNAANEGLLAGGGVCGAIFKAAGYNRLQSACNKIGHCDTGSAVITPGFDMKAKYIIHAVGPVWKGGKHNERELLYGAYCKSLELAADNGCKSIGFPLISSGIFGYPVSSAWHTALDACKDFLDKNPGADMDIIFAVLSDDVYDIGHKALIHSFASLYKIACKEDWNIKEMPALNETFILNRQFTPQQMEVLRRGHIPQEMEDKWFWYMEGDTLFAHRSWTGICIYRVDFKPDNNHIVTVNRSPDEYNCTNADEDKAQLNSLFDWWAQADYNYYGQWLSETVANMKKAGMIPKDDTK